MSQADSFRETSAARPIAKTPAERMREYRARKKSGRCVITAHVDGITRRLELDKGELADGLVERRILKQWDSEDSRAIAFALEQELKKAIDGCS